MGEGIEMTAQVSLFYIVFFAISLVSFLYLFLKIKKNFLIGSRVRLLAKILLAVSVLSLLISPVLFKLSLAPYRAIGMNALQLTNYTVMGLLGLLILFLMASDLGFLISRLGEKLSSLGRRQKKLKEQSKEQREVEGKGYCSRREVLRSGIELGAGGLALGITGLGAKTAFAGPEVVRVTVAIENLPQSFENFTIAQLSDVHIGPTIKRDYANLLVRAVNSLNPDMIALTGDFVDGRVSQIGEATKEFAGLKGKKGAFFVTGNHEYYSGVDEWISEFKHYGITVLENEHVLIPGRDGEELMLAGVHDQHADRFHKSHISDPQLALKQGSSGKWPAIKQENLVKILLAHRPGSIFSAYQANFDLMLSGHTHAGQYYPYTKIVHLFHPYFEGLHLHRNKTWIYVNRGSGYWGPPHRFLNPPEITLIQLRRVRAA